MRQEDLARVAGISVDTIRRFERGDGGLTVKALAAIAIAFGSEHELTELFSPRIFAGHPPRTIRWTISCARSAGLPRSA